MGLSISRISASLPLLLPGRSTAEALEEICFPSDSTCTYAWATSEAMRSMAPRRSYSFGHWPDAGRWESRSDRVPALGLQLPCSSMKRPFGRTDHLELLIVRLLQAHCPTICWQGTDVQNESNPGRTRFCCFPEWSSQGSLGGVITSIQQPVRKINKQDAVVHHHTDHHQRAHQGLNI